MEERYIDSAKTWLKIGLIFVSSIVAVDAGVTYNNFDDISENSAVNIEQSRKIESLQIEIAKLQRPNFANEDKKKFRPGICACLKKENAGKQVFLECPAKNFECDEESRNICESVFTDYEC